MTCGRVNSSMINQMDPNDGERQNKLSTHVNDNVFEIWDLRAITNMSCDI